MAADAADGTVRLFDATTASTPAGNRSSAAGVFYAQHGKILGTGQTDGTVQLWAADTGRPIAALGPRSTRNPVLQTQSSTDGRILALLAADGTGRLCDTQTRHCRTLPLRSFDLALSPDGRTVITDSGKGLLSWDTRAGKLSPAELSHGSARTLAISPDGKTAAAQTADGTVNLLATATGLTLQTLNSLSRPEPYGPHGYPPVAMPVPMAFSPDSRTLAVSAGHGTTSLWDVRSGQLRDTRTASTSPVVSVAFSPDGRTLAAAAADSSLRLWDIATGQTRATLATGRSPATSMAFSPDGHTLAASTNTGTLTWNVPLPRPAQAITAVCTAVHRAPTDQETALYLLDTSPPPACPPAH